MNPVYLVTLDEPRRPRGGALVPFLLGLGLGAYVVGKLWQIAWERGELADPTEPTEPAPAPAEPTGPVPVVECPDGF